MAQKQQMPGQPSGMQDIADKRDLPWKTWEQDIQGELPRMLQRLTDLVQVESPTSDPASVNRAADVVIPWLNTLGGNVVRHSGETTGDILLARFGAASDGRRPLLLLGHLDTVWPLGTLKRMPIRIDAEEVGGPGVLDMKAGVVMAVEALRLMQQVDPQRPVILLLGADEETGSHQSRALIEEVALGCRAVFVLEPAQGPAGAYKTARKGVGLYRLQITGKPAHSGVDFTSGHSAVRELAWQIEQISALTDLARGITVNVGVVGGGTQPNVIAAEAWAEIDVRVPTLADAQHVEQHLQTLRARDPECRLHLAGELNRPPMERTEGTAALFAQARALAAEMSFELEEAATGGGSDGNFTSALGVPTLDGMGAIGKGAHAENESIRTQSLVLRTVLLAAMIASTV